MWLPKMWDHSFSGPHPTVQALFPMPEYAPRSFAPVANNSSGAHSTAELSDHSISSDVDWREDDQKE